MWWPRCMREWSNGLMSKSVCWVKMVSKCVGDHFPTCSYSVLRCICVAVYAFSK